METEFNNAGAADSGMCHIEGLDAEHSCPRCTMRSSWIEGFFSFHDCQMTPYSLNIAMLQRISKPMPIKCFVPRMCMYVSLRDAYALKDVPRHAAAEAEASELDRRHTSRAWGGQATCTYRNLLFCAM